MKFTSAVPGLLLSSWWLSCLSQNVLASSSTTAANHSPLKTFPLVPHHVQRMRRLQEASNHHAKNTDNEELVALQTTNQLRPNDIDSGNDNDHNNIRRRRRRAVAQQVGALFQGYGTHYVDIWVGTPPQRQTVIVDTGSGMTAFPCSQCRQCGVPQYHVDQLFVEADSSTFQANTCANGCQTSRGSCRGGKCQISMGYAEGSRWDAYEAIDKAYLGGPHEIPLVDGGSGAIVQSDDLNPTHASALSFDLLFGCQTYLTGLFKTQLADGIVGMNYRQGEAFWSQMFNAGKMGPEKKFSLCFAQQPTAQRQGTEAGAVTLGGTDTRLHTSQMVYSTNASGGRSGFFSVRVRNIYLREGSAGESVQSAIPTPTIQKLGIAEPLLNQGGVIVDSGTTDTYWNKNLAKVFMDAFQQMSGRTHSNVAVTLTEAELQALPTILFQIEADPTANADKDPMTTFGMAGSLDPQNPTDIIVAFPPSHYMEYDPESGKYTSRFYVTESGGSVLGGNAIMGHDVLFDADNDRIGWAESDCDYTSLVTQNGYDFKITGNLQAPAPVEISASEVVDTAPAPAANPVPGVATPTAQSAAGGMTPAFTPAGGGVTTQAPVPAPTLAPVVDPTAAPIAAPVEMPVEAPVEMPVEAPVEMPVEAPVASVATPTTTEQQAPVAMPVVAPTTTTIATTESSSASGEIEEEENTSKFKQILNTIWSWILWAYGIVKEAVDKFLEVCDTPECRYPVGIGLAIALVAGCCFSYICSCLYSCLCCCCRKKRATGPKYQSLQNNEDDDMEDELEMVNGKSFSSYKDDPLNGSNGKSNGNGRSFKDDEPELNGNGSGSGMQIKMKKTPSKQRKPEFQGDFI